MASATTVFSLGKIDMTGRSLCYSTTLTSPLFAAQPSAPIGRLGTSTPITNVSGPSRHNAGDIAHFAMEMHASAATGQPPQGRNPRLPDNH
jgi:hypothetical protein